MDDEFVWLEEKRIYARLIQLGAHASLVRYSDGINNYEVWVENDEFEFIEPEESDG